MPNQDDWDKIFSEYAPAVDHFAQEKYLHVEKWYHESPCWIIGNKEIDALCWSIQLFFRPDEQRFSLLAYAWLDKEVSVPEGKVHERRLTGDLEKTLVSTWRRGDEVDIKILLEEAYQRASTFSEDDLSDVSSFIEGPDGVKREI